MKITNFEGSIFGLGKKVKYVTPTLELNQSVPKFKYSKSKLRFNMTCSACPEQYDVYYNYGTKDNVNEEIVGYVRLRHGYLYALVCDKEFSYEVEVYNTDDVKGDGCFNDDKERKYHLSKIEDAIYHELNNHQVFWDINGIDRSNIMILGNHFVKAFDKNDDVMVGDYIIVDKYMIGRISQVCLNVPEMKKNKMLVSYYYDSNPLIKKYLDSVRKSEK